MYLLAFREVDLHDLAIHAALYRDGIKRFHRAKAIQVDRQITPLRGGYSDGNTPVDVRVGTTTCGSSCGRFVGTPVDEESSGQDGDQNKNADGASRRPFFNRLMIGVVRMELERYFRARRSFCSFFAHDPLEWLTSAMMI